jgi:Fe-S cluster assembly scaffold protein SufB
MIVGFIVDRCHVGDSNMDVIRYFVSHMKEGHATWKALPRDVRREYLRDIIERHSDNRGLYVSVVSGRI